MSGLELFENIVLDNIDAVSKDAIKDSVVGRGFVYEKSQFKSKEF